MTRRIFPNEENRLAYGYSSAGEALTSKVGSTVTVYTDSSATVLANILTEAGGAVPGSVLTVGADSRIPRFQGPDGVPYGVDTLYAIIQGSATVETLFARYDDRLDRDTVIRCTSATRPTSPTDDQLIYETDTNRVMRYDLGAAQWFIVGGSTSNFIARQNAVTSITNSTDTTVIFQTEDSDSDSQYNNGTGVFTCSKTGLWLFTASLRFAANATGERFIKLVSSNGLEADSSVTTASVDSGGPCTVSMVFYMTAGSTMQCKAFQNSGGALNTAGNNTCLFSGVLLSALP